MPALTFNGSSDYVEYSGGQLVPEPPYTVTLWQRRTNALGIFVSWNSGSLANSDGRGRTGWSNTSFGRLNHQIKDDGGVFGVASSSENLNVNEWIFASYRSSGAANRDVRPNSGTVVTNTSNRTVTGLDTFWLGREKTGASYQYYWQGQLAGLSIFSRVLTEDELDILYNGADPRTLSGQSDHIDSWLLDEIVDGKVIGIANGTEMTVSGATLSEDIDGPELSWGGGSLARMHDLRGAPVMFNPRSFAAWSGVRAAR
ncbi:MAG: LamG-like jellyroll fold domain-containing protein [Leptolyngbyaceae bacterium]|nr:LamG-like jellyroll fold domain-containing protein [Leptolyngbyaceae bacterium]